MAAYTYIFEFYRSYIVTLKLFTVHQSTTATWGPIQITKSGCN